MIKEDCQDHLLLAARQGGRRLWRWLDRRGRRRLPWRAAATGCRTGSKARPAEDFEGFFAEKPPIVRLHATVGDLPVAVLEPALQGGPALRRIERAGMAFERPEELRQRPR